MQWLRRNWTLMIWVVLVVGGGVMAWVFSPPEGQRAVIRYTWEPESVDPHNCFEEESPPDCPHAMGIDRTGSPE